MECSCLLMQNLEVAYLLYRAQYFYPVLVIVCLAAAGIRHVVTLQQQHNKVMALMNQCRLMPVIQGKWVRATASHRLVPGDVVVLQEGRAVCDMVMLRGACLVTESMLSGEVHPFTSSNQDRELCSYCVLSAWSLSLCLVLRSVGQVMVVCMSQQRGQGKRGCAL